MKRFFCLFSALLLLGTLTACKKESAVPTEIQKDNLKVGVICNTEKEAQCSEAWAYREQAISVCEGFGMAKKQVLVKPGVPYLNPTFAEKAARNYIDKGCALIVGTVPGYAAAMRKLAAEFPQVTFAQIGEPDETLSNYYTLQLRTYQGAYLCGIVAGLQSGNGKLGIVAPLDTENTEICSMVNAFLLGARAVNPEAEGLLWSTGTEQNDTKETEAVEKLAAAGCDVLLQLTRGETVTDIAAEKGVKVCRMFSTMPTEGDTVVFSVVPQLDKLYTDAVQNLLDKLPFTYQNAYIGFAEDAFSTTLSLPISFDPELRVPDENADPSAETETAEPDAQQLLAAAERLMSEGEWDVFSGVSLVLENGEFQKVPTAVKGLDGQQHIAAETPLSDADIKTGMQWLAEGILLF